MRSDIEFFLKEKFNSGMLILGDWGIGKTYAIKKITNDILSKSKNYKHISYVAMNGMTKLDQIEESIYRNKKNIGESINTTIVNILKTKIDLKKYLELSKIYLENDIRNTLIIIDDFERSFFSHPENVNEDEGEIHFFLLVVGLLNRLTQENNSKFIIIMNKNVIKNIDDAITKSSEKHLSKIINFEQTDQTFNIAMNMLEEIEGENEIFKSNRDKLNKLNKYITTNNIRIAYKSLLSYFNILKLKLHIDIKNNSEDSKLNKLIEDYFLFLCILNSIGLLEARVISDSSFIQKANSILRSFKNKEVIDINLIKICEKIINNEIFEIEIFSIPPLARLLYTHDHGIADLKQEISCHILNILKKISDNNVLKLINKIKTSVKPIEKKELLCISNDSKISQYDLIYLIYYLEDRSETSSILMRKFDHEVETTIESNDEAKLKNLIKLIKRSPIIKYKNENSKKLIDAKERLNTKLNEVIEKNKHDEINKKNTQLTNNEVISFFKEILLLINNPISNLNKLRNQEITYELRGDSSLNNLSVLKSLFDKIKYNNSLEVAGENNAEILFMLTKHLECHKLKIEDDKFKNNLDDLELKQIHMEMNDFLNSVFTYIGEVKSNLWDKNPDLEKSMNLYIAEWYPE
ncbi:hypothetical protein [Morganella morganii]|uniref:hypothetical protein n=1 Tax=Morganella TaxID=581 RepID=UPI00370A1CA8